METSKIAVIGDRDSVMLWDALGVHTVFVTDDTDVDRNIHRLAREGVAVIYITEQAALRAADSIGRYKTEPYPAIIPIPNRNGSIGLGKQGISSNIEKAIGADILFEEEGNS